MQLQIQCRESEEPIGTSNQQLCTNGRQDVWTRGRREYSRPGGLSIIFIRRILEEEDKWRIRL